MSQTPSDTDRTGDPDRTTDTTTDRRTDHDTYDTDTMKWVSGIVSVIGLWIAASPFLYDVTQMALWNNVIVGLGIFLVAGYNFYRMSSNKVASPGTAALVAVLGLWMIAAPFVLEIGSEALGWSNVVSGALVALIAGYNAYESKQATAHTGTRA